MQNIRVRDNGHDKLSTYGRRDPAMTTGSVSSVARIH
ncbi:hypothetical protein OH492_01500 [Vibrio chagasii]|nr:hypothetical protein [Vibrio chagasii]